MAKLHGFYDAVHDHGGTEAGPQPQEQHLSTLIAPEGLHRGIIHDLDWTLKRSFKVIAHPPASEVPRVRQRSIVDDRPGIADRYRVILPVLGELLDAGDHLLGSQRGPGWQFPRYVLSGSEELHVGSADIDNQHIHDATSPYLPGLHKSGALGSDDTHQLVPGIDEQRGPFVLEPCGHNIDVNGKHGALTITWETHTAPCLQDKRRRCAQRGWAGHLPLRALPLSTANGVSQGTYHPALTHDDFRNSLSKKV